MKNILEIKYEKIFNECYAIKIIYQDNNILIPNSFLDKQLKIRCEHGSSYFNETFGEFIIGYGEKSDIFLVSSEDNLNKLLNKIKQLNEKYKDFFGYYPKNNTTYYYLREGNLFYDDLFIIEEKVFRRDDVDLKNYSKYNCFSTKEEAEYAIKKLSETLKNIRKETLSNMEESNV